jgi:hypothetical protein
MGSPTGWPRAALAPRAGYLNALRVHRIPIVQRTIVYSNEILRKFDEGTGICRGTSLTAETEGTIVWQPPLG